MTVQFISAIKGTLYFLALVEGKGAWAGKGEGQAWTIAGKVGGVLML
jgi:hypothetical protein